MVSAEKRYHSKQATGGPKHFGEFGFEKEWGHFCDGWERQRQL